MSVSTGKRFTAATALLVAIGSFAVSDEVAADQVTFSGTVTYQGSYAGDSLYVAVLDTVGVEDVTLLDVAVIAADPPPFSHPYSLEFDNAGVASQLIIASFLDVDGGGIDDITGADVFGWYGEGTEPAAIASAASQSALDFALPRAEIHGTITFADGQTEARANLSGDVTCEMGGFRPGYFAFATGAYAIIGVYPGTYCVSADDDTGTQSLHVCYGDATCQNPTPVTLTETEVRTGIDLDFSAIVPVQRSSWAQVKALYRE